MKKKKHRERERKRKKEEGVKSKERKREKLAIQGKYNAKVQQEKHDGCQTTKLGVPQGEWVKGEGSLSWGNQLSLNDYSIIPLTLAYRYKLRKSPFDLWLSDIHVEIEREDCGYCDVFVFS